MAPAPSIATKPLAHPSKTAMGMAWYTEGAVDTCPGHCDASHPIEPRNKQVAAYQTQLPPYRDELNVSFGRSAVAPSPRTREAKSADWHAVQVSR